MATENVSSYWADEMLAAFVEVERAIHGFAVSLISKSFGIAVGRAKSKPLPCEKLR